ncbi:MAG: MFS transporter [Bacteroidetes bacterium]|nr:MFS transporter [Bacteroidota bacterium]
MNEVKSIQLGLKENWKQFTILVIVNAFVGGMIGMERSIFPEFAHTVFNIDSNIAILSFIIAFGLTKAFTNYFTGRLANKFGRKNLLLAGWIVAMPIPFILIYANHWNWVILANLLLGVSQGLTWSSTVVMKIDLVGDKDRGLAMGFNEFAGYLSVGVIAFFTAYIANRYGITPYPFYIGIVLSFTGLLLTIFFVKDTRSFIQHANLQNTLPDLTNVFVETTFKNKTLSSITQAGLVNNLNDGMIWGLLPIVLLSYHFDAKQIGIIAAVYPMVWGIGQLFTGKLSDIYPKKTLLFWGMFIQGLAIISIPYGKTFAELVSLSTILGLGTALVYPTFLSAIAEASSPNQRAETMGTFRLWRDLGYVFGAIISGITADLFGLHNAILFIGIITIISSLIIKFRMPIRVQVERECIEVEQVKRILFQRKKLVLIDVRSYEEYEQSHIPSAIHIALNDLKEKIKLLDSHYQLITVCGKGGGRSAEGANLLRQFGYKANWLCGGTIGWYEKSRSHL